MAIGITLADVHLNWLNWFHFLILEGSLLVILVYRLHDFSVTITRCHKDVYVNGFFPCRARPLNSLTIEYFPLTYDLNHFKSRINRHLRFFLNIFSVCLNLFVILFLVTPCLVVAVRPCMEWIPILKKALTAFTVLWNCLKDYLCYKTILSHKIALDVQLMNFFIWRKNNISFLRYWDFCVFVKAQISKSVTPSQALLDNRSYTYVYFFWILSTIKMKFGQILVCYMTNISNIFLAECWRLETSSRLFSDFIKMTI